MSDAQELSGLRDRVNQGAQIRVRLGVSPGGTQRGGQAQRIGTGGKPVWYQIAVPVAIWRRHRSPPYHSGIRIVVQTVVRDERSWVSLGSLRPFLGGRPIFRE